jgi:hypothetical protein
VYGPPIGLGIGRGGGSQLMLQAGMRGGEIWKVDGCLLVVESTQNNGARPHLVGGLVIPPFLHAAKS